MRIVYLSASTLPSTDANAVQVMKMCNGLVRRGHEVVLVARRPTCGGAVATEDVFGFYGVEQRWKIIWLHTRRVKLLRVVAQVVQLVRLRRLVRRADVLYGRHALGLLLSAVDGVDVLYECHEVPSARWRRILERYLLSRPSVRRIVFISRGLCAEYMARVNVSNVSVVVAHDGADAGVAIDDGSLVSSEVSLHWPGRRGCLQVGYVGSLYEGKGADEVLNMASRLPDMDFHIVGTGAARDVERIRCRSGGSNVFVHGFVPPSGLWAYYSKFDIVVVPPQRSVVLRDGRTDIARWMSPLKLFEAMGHGKPMLVSDLPVLREVVTDERTGILVEPANVAMWCKRLEELKDPERRQRIGAEAQAEVASRYSWEVRADAVLEGLGREGA